MKSRFLLSAHIVLCLLPIGYILGYIYWHFSEEFFKYTLRYLGLCGIYFLAFVMIASFFIDRFFSQRFVKLLGVFTLFYTMAHIGIYLISEINPSDFFSEIFKRAYLFYGFLSFVLISILAISSLFYKKLFKYLSSLGYICGILGSIHMMLASKIPSLLSYGFFAIFLFLLCYRLLKRKI